jgi:hypothetical protein
LVTHSIAEYQTEREGDEPNAAVRNAGNRLDAYGQCERMLNERLKVGMRQRSANVCIWVIPDPNNTEA